MIPSLICLVALTLAPFDIARGQAVSPPAQDSSPPPAATPPSATAPDKSASKTSVQPLTVIGKAPDYRRQIDRRSYSLGNDLQAANGSLADALRNIPSIEVDPEGNVTLRGAGVTILVDGEPSPLFQGPQHGDILQQLPASQYERVEVITNPSAAFRPEGTGGIINLITRKARKPGATGSVGATASSQPEERGSASGSYASGPLTLAASAGVAREQRHNATQVTEQIADPASGQTAQVTDDSVTAAQSTSWNANASASYKPDGRTQLSGDLSYGRFQSSQTEDGAYHSSATSGVLAQDRTYAGPQNELSTFLSGSATYLRELGGDDHDFHVRVGLSSAGDASDDRALLTYQLPAQANLFQDNAAASTLDEADVKVEYKGPLAKGKLDFGYDGAFKRDSFDYSTRLGTSAADAAPDPLLADRFDYGEAANALFATYQHAFGKLDLMPGLRLEEVAYDTRDPGSPAETHAIYFEVDPSFHLGYQLNADTQLTASYSRRVDRPAPQQLDPFRIYYNPLAFAEGNPQLRPATTDSFEAAYEYTKGQTYFTVTLYDRDTGRLVTQLSENLGGGAILSTFANIGHSQNTGVEVVASGKLSRTLSFNLSGNVLWNRLVAPDDGVEASRAGAQAFGQAKLNWNPTASDFVQLSGFYQGKQLNPQGFISSYWLVDLGYRHKFNDRLSGEMIVRDPFDSLRFNSATETSTLHQRLVQDLRLRSISVGLTYALGGPAKPAAGDFDFGGTGGR